MVIKASASAEIRTLVDALVGADDVKREAAVARLAVIGERAVERLIDGYAKTSNRLAHVAILRTLEPIGDHRGGVLAAKAICEGSDVGVAATGVLRALLTSPHPPAATSALDTLMAVALDEQADRTLRLAAFEALQDLPPDIRTRVEKAVSSTRDRASRDVASQAGGDAARAEAVWRDAIEGHLPDDPKILREAAASRAASAPLGDLQKIIDAVRSKESGEDIGWEALRGSLHQALALRGSRVALYDLRETVERANKPLPVSFLAALHVLGDASCLEPIAGAWSRVKTSSPTDERWRYQLTEAFRAIAKREKITRRHAVVKRIAARWPEFDAFGS